MMDPLLAAFLSDDFSTVYSRFATAHWARTALELDVPGLQAPARLAINTVVQNANADGDPASRIVLVKGDAGLGKTHVLSTELARLTTRGRAFPVLMQLAVSVSPEDLSRWLLKKLFDELLSSNFPDADGNCPMARLAIMLWAHAPKEQEKFTRKIEQDPDDEEGIDRIAFKAAGGICRGMRRHGLSNDDRVVVAGILARAADNGSAFKAWINHSSVVQQFGGRSLEPIRSEDDRRDLIISLARVCRACGAPLILAVDQIEATEQIASLDLLRRLLVYAVNLVDDSVQGIGLVICALSDTIAKLDDLPAPLMQRLEYDPTPVQLRAVKPRDVRRMLERRAQLLLQRRALRTSETEAALAFSPDWLLEDASGRPRNALERVQRYRERCREARRFLSREEYEQWKDGDDSGSGETPAAPDYDKLWEDKRDAAIGGIRNFSDHQRLELIGWLIEAAAREIPSLACTRVTQHELTGAEPIRVLRTEFMLDEDTCLEAWDIGFADAPVRKGRLRKQIELLLDECRDAKPAIARAGSITGFEGNRLTRSHGALKRTATGPALVALLEMGGRVCPAESRHWDQLATAREFIGEFADSPGFDGWRIERRFLTRECDIGPLAILAQPEGRPDAVLPSDPPADPQAPDPANQGAHTSADPNHNARTSADPRDRARILIGHGGPEPVFWNMDRDAEPTLPNFGLTVSGDAGQGKTQIIKAVLAEAADLGCPILVFDFKNDYTDEFAGRNGFQVVNLENGLPFNPLRPPPQGESGAQIMRHVHEIGAVMATTLGLGDQQTGLLRRSIAHAFESRGQPLNEWLAVESIRTPSLSDAVAAIEQEGSGVAANLINRLGLLHELRMLPDDASATLSFDELMAGRYVLSFKSLPNDDKLKAVLAEMILIQLQGFMLRGEQPKALRRMLVFDEAWRASQSARLIQLAREGRAFGVAVVVGTQFADDLSPDLVGNLATKLYLYNSDAQRRRRIVKAILGTTSGKEAATLADELAAFEQFEAIFCNQQHAPYRRLRVTPDFERPHPPSQT